MERTNDDKALSNMARATKAIMAARSARAVLVSRGEWDSSHTATFCDFLSKSKRARTEAMEILSNHEALSEAAMRNGDVTTAIQLLITALAQVEDAERWPWIKDLERAMHELGVHSKVEALAVVKGDGDFSGPAVTPRF